MSFRQLPEGVAPAHTCEHCQSLVIRPKVPCPPDGYRINLPLTVQDAQLGAAAGCLLCQYLIHFHGGNKTQFAMQSMFNPRSPLLSHDPDKLFINRSLWKRLDCARRSFTSKPFEIYFKDDKALIFAGPWGGYTMHVVALPSKLVVALSFPLC
jgi:hypothetical protein